MNLTFLALTILHQLSSVNFVQGDHEKFSQALRVECLLWVIFHEANKKRDGLLLEAKRLQNKLMDSDNNSDEKEARG